MADSTRRIVVKGNPSWLPESLRHRPEPVTINFRFSKAERMILRKRSRIPVSEWATRHRIVTRGPLQGTRFRKETAPYLSPIMDAAFAPSVETVILCAAPQTGKSFVVDTCVGYSIDRDPGPVLYVYPDEDTATENSKDRILPMIRQSPRLRTYLTGSIDDEAAKRIRLQHMEIYLGWARSAIKLGNKSIRLIVFDEVDKYPLTSGLKEADPLSLGEARSTTYRYGKKIFKVSTPTVEAGPIWQALTTEAQAIFDFWVRCPECGQLQWMLFTGIKFPPDERDPERIENEDLAEYECSHCQARWDDHKRDRAVARGEWRRREGGESLREYLSTARPRKIAFHLPSWISRFVPLSKVAADFLRGQTDKNRLKHFKNAHQAEPWVDYEVHRDEDRLLALRDERPRGLVPSGGVVSALTAGIDTQAHGFWYEVRAWGWGITLESWGIREGFVDSFQALDEVLFFHQYYDVDGNEFFIHIAVQDAMGDKTAQVYDFVRLHPGRMIAYQGVDTRRMTAPLRWSKIDTYPGSNKPIPGGLRLLRADTVYFKNLLAGKLEVAPEDPGAWHLHSETTREHVRHLTSEYIDEAGNWKCPQYRENHLWDCAVENLVAAEVLQIKFWRPQAKREETPPRRPGQSSDWIPKSSGWFKRG